MYKLIYYHAILPVGEEQWRQCPPSVLFWVAGLMSLFFFFLQQLCWLGKVSFWRQSQWSCSSRILPTVGGVTQDQAGLRPQRENHNGITSWLLPWVHVTHNLSWAMNVAMNAWGKGNRKASCWFQKNQSSWRSAISLGSNQHLQAEKNRGITSESCPI